MASDGPLSVTVDKMLARSVHIARDKNPKEYQNLVEAYAADKEFLLTRAMDISGDRGDEAVFAVKAAESQRRIDSAYDNMVKAGNLSEEVAKGLVYNARSEGVIRARDRMIEDAAAMEIDGNPQTAVNLTTSGSAPWLKPAIAPRTAGNIASGAIAPQHFGPGGKAG